MTLAAESLDQVLCTFELKARIASSDNVSSPIAVLRCRYEWKGFVLVSDKVCRADHCDDINYVNPLIQLGRF